ncbi:hypothetical protein PTTG_29463 [Puccinia triticina 1-1 BBBD Race 1]|uniref:DDE Tnp4 domain-containing protein n=1 Tax=Puccinia triticina (isolate 1-1 / race 1 (BBBD)) TaxID=630390 RepID=A0A180G3X6_PUCT1|nr:hypothetical protein PTTG_29463 [Puccinia triticina 1-1 BBBD Race 1]
MSLDNFRWLSDQLRPQLQQDPLRQGDPLSVEAQVAVGLYRLGHGATYVNIGHVFNIGKETANKASGRFVKAVLRVLSNRSVSGLPSKIPLNGSMASPILWVPLTAPTYCWLYPPHNEWKGYINRKSWASIVFQCVVDGDSNLRNVSGGGPGSMHDTQVFRRSWLGHSLLGYGPPMIPAEAMLIGDAGYPEHVPILVPYPSVATQENKDFNYIQSLTWIVVERAFGQLKNRCGGQNGSQLQFQSSRSALKKTTLKIKIQISISPSQNYL